MHVRLAALATCALAAASLVVAPRIHAHATYNTSGYGAGLAGSTNGADGSPTGVPAAWTNGPIEGYVGGLPVNWYAGMHNATQVRTIQTGVTPNPPSGSLLQQIVTFNADNDPDFPTDVVLAVGGQSWLNPDWPDPLHGVQGWGHGLDYGLVHFSPLDTLLAGGPLAFTITVTDDPSDENAPQLAFALYGGWDANPGSSRHQTFISSPAPVDNPLGSTGLTLIDFAAATAPGQTVSRTYALDPTYGGRYTLIIGAQGASAGQYQVTVTTAPDAALAHCRADLEAALAEAEQPPALVQCRADLAESTAAMTAASADADTDGKRDQDDACAGTPAGAPVDALGCSQTQFCATFDATTRPGRNACARGDWKNDEPLMKKGERDCTVDKAAKACRAAL